MKKPLLLIFALAGISLASGELMSRSSWIGKVGMTFFYKEYNCTKVWWQGAIMVFLLLMLFYTVHSLLQRLPVIAAKAAHLLLLLAAASLLYYTYNDFHTNIAHRMLRHRFHYGVYLVWIGWMLIAVYFLFRRRQKKPATQPATPTIHQA